MGNVTAASGIRMGLGSGKGIKPIEEEGGGEERSLWALWGILCL